MAIGRKRRSTAVETRRPCPGYNIVMTWVRCSLLVLVAVASACTRKNPAFDEGTGDETRGDPTHGSGSQTGPDSGPPTVPPPTTGVTSVDTTHGEDTEGTSESASTTQPSEGTEGEETSNDTGPPLEACMLHDPYDVSIAFAMLPPPAPCGDITSYAVMPGGGATGSSFQALVCTLSDTCPCDIELGVFVEVEIFGPVPEPLPECFVLEIERFPGLPGSCPVAAYSIVRQGVPVAIGSNVVNPAVTEPFEFGLAKEPTQPCTDDCDGGAAGYYALTSSVLLQPLEPDGVAVPYTDGETELEVANVGSGIMPREMDAPCMPLGRWEALQ